MSTTPLDPTVAHVLDTHPTDLSSDDEDALISSLESDPSLPHFREQRIQQLHTEYTRAKHMRSQSYGTYSLISDEKSLMDITTSTHLSIVHFFKPDFNRCAIMDGHLETLAPKHFDTRFLRINVENAPFLITKMNVRVLPCVIAFVGGVSVDRIIGFEGLGYSEGTFTTADLEARLLKAGVLTRVKTTGDEVVRQQRKQEEKEEEDDDDWD